MTKQMERAEKARSLLSRGEQKMATEKALGYKSVGGMLGAIKAYEAKLQRGEIKKRKVKAPKILPAVMSTDGIRIDAAGEAGEYIRLEGKHIVASYIAYRGSVNIGAKANPGYLRLYEATLGNRQELIAALAELQTMAGMLIAMIEVRGHEKKTKDQ